jgi:hypothetical protein
MPCAPPAPDGLREDSGSKLVLGSNRPEGQARRDGGAQRVRDTVSARCLEGACGEK